MYRGETNSPGKVKLTMLKLIDLEYILTYFLISFHTYTYIYLTTNNRKGLKNFVADCILF